MRSVLKFSGVGVQRRVERSAPALLAALAMILGACAFTLATRHAPASDGPVAIPVPATGFDVTARSGPAPVSISIPAIGVSASIVDLGIDVTGVLIPPSDVSTVGWYAGGAAPGNAGPAVLVGHVDSQVGPAVFWRLRSLHAGDVVAVTDADQQVHRFVVRTVEQYPKSAFPTSKVYGPQSGATLRLVTCGGTFDPKAGHYRDNVVVYADGTD